MDGSNTVMNWQDSPRVKKGNIGERLVKEYLINKGYIPYIPDAPGAHPFDLLVASADKRNIFIADSKAKPARKYYPDTGIDLRHYKEYTTIEDKHNLNVFLFFVDEDAGNVYGNFLKRLSEPREIIHIGIPYQYPLIHKGIIYFPLVSMIQIADIPKIDVDTLREYSTRNKAYTP